MNSNSLKLVKLINLWTKAFEELERLRIYKVDLPKRELLVHNAWYGHKYGHKSLDKFTIKDFEKYLPYVENEMKKKVFRSLEDLAELLHEPQQIVESNKTKTKRKRVGESKADTSTTDKSKSVN